VLVLAGSAHAAPPADTLQSDIAPAYRPAPSASALVRREVMIPMRDGVRLHTVVVMRPGTTGGPMVVERTPYGADSVAARPPGPLDTALLDDGYIRVWQDVRGRYGSEGVYVTNRPLTGPQNLTGLDHATDAYDTIEWLVKNLPEGNGRVGVIGGSYAGFTTLMATLGGHPALAAAVAINPMVDVWMGDDWFHHGAFRQITLNVLPIIMGGKGGGAPDPHPHAAGGRSLRRAGPVRRARRFPGLGAAGW
jgi:predicted acyl esterase